MNLRLYFFFSMLILTGNLFAKTDSICGHPLRYVVLSSNEPTEGFFWTAGDKKYNVYYKGGDFILEEKKKHVLWLVSGTTFNVYPGTEMFIDTVYFKNTSESPEKELVIGYSTYSMKPDDSGKGKHLMIIDLRDKMILLNIAIYDYRLKKDENGKFWDYLYECDADMFHDGLRITTSDDSEISDVRIQLDDGIYVRKGHCFVSHK